MKAYGSVSLDESSLLVTATIQRVVDPSEYELSPSSSTVVYDASESAYTPSSVQFTFKENNAITGIASKNAYWRIVDGKGTSRGTGSNVSSYTITSTTLNNVRNADAFPITVSVYGTSSDSTPMAKSEVNSVSKSYSASLIFNPAELLYDADNAGLATATTDNIIDFDMYVGGDKVTPSSADDVTIEWAGGTTTGAAILPGTTTAHVKIRVSSGKSPVCQAKVTATATYGGEEYTAVGYLSIRPLREGPQGGTVGSLGKMYYYAGEYDSTKRYYLQETQAPYVSKLVNDNEVFYMLDNAANDGATGSWMGVDPETYHSSNPWTVMTSENKYYIAEAMFSNFAKLGAAIFNQDFMLSQHGTLKGYGDMAYAVNGSTWYRYADASNMQGEFTSWKVTPDTAAHTVDNSAYQNTSSYRKSLGYLSYGKLYLIRLNTTVIDKSITVEVASNLSSAPLVTATINSSSTKDYYIPVACNTAGSYYLYWKNSGTGSTNPTINNIYVSEAVFVPNAYVDWLKGFIYGQRGIFKDVTVEGKINNLITVIDWKNNIGRDKIIEAYYNTNGEFVGYTQGTSGVNLRYYIDALNCGDYVWIKSLPSTGTASPYTYYRLPFFGVHRVAGLEDRGHTRDMDGNPHQMTAEEMYKLVGRRITIRTSTQTYYNCITGLLSLDPVQSTDTINVANGRHYYYYQSGNAQSYQKSIHLIPQVVHIECQAAVWSTLPNEVNYWGYGYVWVGCDGIGTNTSHEDEIAQYWT